MAVPKTKKPAKTITRYAPFKAKAASFFKPAICMLFKSPAVQQRRQLLNLKLR